MLSDKDTLEKVYQDLLEQHRVLQTNYVRKCCDRIDPLTESKQDDVTAERSELTAQLNQARREVESMQGGTISSKVGIPILLYM